MTGNAPFVAGGNVRPSRFVELDATADNRVIEAVASTSRPIGISQVAKRNPPYSTLDDGFCAIAGEPLRVFQQGEIAPVEAGAAITRGARIRMDHANADATLKSRALTAAVGEPAFAVALQSAAGAGEVIECTIIFDTVNT